MRHRAPCTGLTPPPAPHRCTAPSHRSVAKKKPLTCEVSGFLILRRWLGARRRQAQARTAQLQLQLQLQLQ
jgi:hypothetical protein